MRHETFISYNEILCVGLKSTLFQLIWLKECYRERTIFYEIKKDFW